MKLVSKKNSKFLSSFKISFASFLIFCFFVVSSMYHGQPRNKQFLHRLHIDHSCCFHAANNHQHQHAHTPFNKDFAEHNITLDNTDNEIDFSKNKHIFNFIPSSIFRINSQNIIQNQHLNIISIKNPLPLYALYCNWKFHTT